VDFLSCLSRSKDIASLLGSRLAFEDLLCPDFDLLNPLLGARVPLVDFNLVESPGERW